MKNFKDFICHGCLKKYKYNGDYKEFVNRKCMRCGYVVWTKEEQDLVEKLEHVKTEEAAALTLATLTPLEKRLFQYWSFAAFATTALPICDEDIMENLE